MEIFLAIRVRSAAARAKATPDQKAADIAGTSKAEIRKTYKHKDPEGRTRMARKQARIWQEMGSDENGNKPSGAVVASRWK
jgi:hypothetical protein